jgi:hypothetical protein
LLSSSFTYDAKGFLRFTYELLYFLLTLAPRHILKPCMGVHPSRPDCQNRSSDIPWSKPSSKNDWPWRVSNQLPAHTPVMSFTGGATSSSLRVKRVRNVSIHIQCRALDKVKQLLDWMQSYHEALDDC